MKSRSSKYLLLIMSLFAFHGHASAADQLTTAQAHSIGTMITNKDGLEPGGSILVGVHIELEPNWHTYWKNPGDSASTAIFDYSLPPGYKSSPLNYGIPKRIPVGPLVSFGYEHETVLYATVSIPDSESNHLGEMRTLQIAAEWVVCKEECLPAFFDFTLTLPISKEPRATAAAALFQQTSKGMQSDTWYDATFSRHSNGLIEVEIPVTQELGQLRDLIPYPKQMIANGAVEIAQSSPVTYQATFKYEKRDKVDENSLQLLAIYQAANGEKTAVSLRAEPRTSPFGGMAAFAFLGGLLLNLMPCVFPVLALKLFGFMKVNAEGRKSLIIANLVYLLGVLVSFWILAGLLVGFRASGAAVGWGFQMQSPFFVMGMILLFFTLGLNFVGVFEFSGRLAGAGHSLTKTNDWKGSFFTGVLAVIVASPCTAPFMGAAMGYSLSQPPTVTFAIFTFLGLGLGIPYVLFAAFPHLSRILPRPGMWMIRFKEFMAFPMWATCIWLIYVLYQLTGPLAVVSVLTFCLGTGGILWSLKTFERTPAKILSSLIFLAVAATPPFLLGIEEQQEHTVRGSDDFWTRFDEEQLAIHVAQGDAVFVNFTAAWCISCQVNDKTTFQNFDVREYVRNHKIVMMKGDWTNRDVRIGNYLARFGRAGVPLYLYFAAGAKEAQILPEILTPKDFLKRLQSH